MRIGHGYDVHKFGSDKPLLLGGIEVPYEQGLIAHSDGDVVLHAITDAVLGALALGDIGHHFPDTDANYAGANSSELLAHIITLAKQRQWVLGNLDVTIVAQAPRLAESINAMKQHIADLFNSVPDNVNVKATTTEKLGFVGRKEGIACHAVVLLKAHQ
ncbi:2-C-methyl-D-erythritol 2,4-cyclodiphosphate synthase [Pseudidiomarina piscicola]|uniref:2-C-methyl-D-erythritol 2,4-cyclodiphosphate synthase n=1 Tax=Pseudidiomarina piscicola TaxID=2614830 RepID=A0A6S6WKW2_9GAMM|nr:2-C-methyl-D-erythritol 2,4-cyclodiphosphate synthase [Pseudidiomarina piscicola]CAB0149861.1 2-C-methyl-D-erythritol 2,4-cyclodiphosphate synthase [Pseudidiomarina piscicola]VZT39309.1 2-C-methyl-D-erythritol 2,4-cyclodiphosphate synthase [Pseudomonas aeruginosa]